jgi:hypothetical protein
MKRENKLFHSNEIQFKSYESLRFSANVIQESLSVPPWSEKPFTSRVWTEKVKKMKKKLFSHAVTSSANSTNR